MAPPRPPPELMDDATAEILLRLPACLVRAALVCKPWRRILSDPTFLRRYSSFHFHGAPPLLGLLRNVYDDSISTFVPTTSFRSRGHGFPGGIAVDCCHGRALLLDYTSLLREWRVDILVWDPVTGDRRRLRNPDDVPLLHSSAAVLCAADGCAHLDCRGGPFLVVFVGSDCHFTFGADTKACVYASHTGAWSSPASIELGPGDTIRQMGSFLIGEALYFFRAQGILRYDLGNHRLSAIDQPAWYDFNMTLMEAEGGGLGLAGLKGSSLHLWYREGSPDGVDRWAQSRVIELDALPTLEPFYHPMYMPLLMGSAEGTHIVFVSTGIGNYMVDLKSMQIKNIGEGRSFEYVLPYMSFYIPDCARGKLPSSMMAQQ